MWGSRSPRKPLVGSRGNAPVGVGGQRPPLTLKLFLKKLSLKMPFWR